MACVFVHEDLDKGGSDEYPRIRDRVQKALETAFDTVHYTPAVEEIEAWLLLFPDALSAFCETWTVPPRHRGEDSGRIADPKGVLKNEISRAGRTYRESDAPEILARAAELGIIQRPVGSNRSFEHLRSGIARCCAEHLKKRGG